MFPGHRSETGNCAVALAAINRFRFHWTLLRPTALKAPWPQGGCSGDPGGVADASGGRRGPGRFPVQWTPTGTGPLHGKSPGAVLPAPPRRRMPRTAPCFGAASRGACQVGGAGALNPLIAPGLRHGAGGNPRGRRKHRTVGPWKHRSCAGSPPAKRKDPVPGAGMVQRTAPRDRASAGNGQRPRCMAESRGNLRDVSDRDCLRPRTGARCWLAVIAKRGPLSGSNLSQVLLGAVGETATTVTPCRAWCSGVGPVPRGPS